MVYPKDTNLKGKTKGANKMLNKYDIVAGTTTCASKNGTFVELEDGQQAWIHRIYLPRNTKVLCTVYEVKESGFPVLMLDSVDYRDIA